MARIRSIKPEFFLHDGIAELPVLTRLLFIGLWTHCDAQGRCEDRPRRIKAAILPYDDCDCDAMLTELANAGFIVRYQAQGEAYIAIPTWSSHQRITGKEAETASRYPAPGKQPGASQEPPDQVSDLNRETPEKQPEEPQIEPEKQQGNNGETTGKQLVSLEGKGKDRKGEESKYVVEEGCGEKPIEPSPPPSAPTDVGAKRKQGPKIIHGLSLLEWYGRFKDAYPKRIGDYAWPKAKERFERLVSGGRDPAEIIAGTERYAAWAEATGRAKTEYVKQAATFLSDQAWTEEWEIPDDAPKRRSTTFGSAQTLIDRLGDQVAM